MPIYIVTVEVTVQARSGPRATASTVAALDYILQVSNDDKALRGFAVSPATVATRSKPALPPERRA
jgi:hypothetical protein